MIDNLALAISHGLMMLAAIILLRRPDLNHEPSPRDIAEEAAKNAKETPRA